MPGIRLSLWRREPSPNTHGFDSRPHSPPSVERSSRRTKISGACSTIRVQCCAGPTWIASSKRVWCGDCLTARSLVLRAGPHHQALRHHNRCPQPLRALVAVLGMQHLAPTKPGRACLLFEAMRPRSASPAPRRRSCRSPVVRAAGAHRTVSMTGHPRAQDPSNGPSMGSTPWPGPFEGSLRGPPPVRGTLRGVSPTGAPRAHDPSKGLPKGVPPHKSPFEGSRDDFLAGVRNHGGSPWIAIPANAR